ncbi:MAG TPA: phosphatase PAP2 family protein [Acidimicrobiales bacterium]|jgi:uncharacterized membrane protein YkvA (DUF1232 family)|nr:phosphatase PAP2 family protein [Acidimicrobiales bacterium]
MAVTADDPLGLAPPIVDTEWLAEPKRRSPLWVEALAIVWLCWLYDEINNFSPLRLHAALAHANSLLHVENIFHINPELTLNAWAAAHRGLALSMSDFYDTAHFVVTLGLVALLWWRHPERYRPLRNTLVLINVIGFLVFWCYPLAPPRMLPAAGFLDLVAVTHAWGSWRASAVASQANELAAMPSLHIAWACWCSLAVWQILPGRRWRALVVIYPVMTALVVMATANHFLLDVVAGVATIVAAAALAQLLHKWRLARWPGWSGPPPILSRPTRDRLVAALRTATKDRSGGRPARDSGTDSRSR